jgi:hypothetical protein
MTFGAKDPFLNEPGLAETSANSPQSISYTKNVQCKAVLHAMLWWLSSDKAKNSVWGEIREIYWAIKGEQVMKTVREWAKINEFLKRCSKNNPGSQLRLIDFYDGTPGRYGGGGSSSGIDLLGI